ncbi:ABC transporter ATP-binding protein [Mesoaciditoga lauensis]|uniref:ABC transporter ATP-binding protein n=1 Tax=Mesoaciditoga lauensis TaxID=1495039 RepID=UPI00056AAEEC|nr:ABC transporter ATP-binding protein [Mesoaciditoga lauensis]
MVIKVENLVKKYKDITAVNDVSFSVEEGEIFGIIGPNGAGKTTTIECIEGLRKPDSGSVEVLGLNPLKDRKKLYNMIGVQLQETSYQDKIKVWEICQLFSTLYSKTLSYELLLKDFGLYEKKDSYISKLSGGQKQAVSIVLALIPDPKIVFLDEITTGLDPQARRNVWEMIKKLKKKGKTVFMTTHYMEEAENLCDRICFIKSGKVKALGTVNGLIKASNMQLKVVFKANDLNVDELNKIENVESVKKDGERYIVYARNEEIVKDVMNYLTGKKIEFREFSIVKPNLEDVYLNIVKEPLEVEK